MILVLSLSTAAPDDKSVAAAEQYKSIVKEFG
jgi:hypothetical protein